MKERPILFSGEMVRAILDGRKTVTRRVCKFNAAGRLKLPGSPKNWHRDDPDAVQACPYGQPGDRLVFLSTWAAPKEYDKVKPSRLPKDVKIWTLFDVTEKPPWAGRRRPGRFMPKWMRPRMPKGEVTGVRVERVQDITEEDAKAEGVACLPNFHGSHKGSFLGLWESLNAKSGFGWDKNPHVWVVEFRRIGA